MLGVQLRGEVPAAATPCYAGFCFITVMLAFTSFFTNAFGIALSIGKLIMALVVA